TTTLTAPTSSTRCRRSSRRDGAVNASISPRSVTTCTLPTVSIEVTESILLPQQYGAGMAPAPSASSSCARSARERVVADDCRVRARRVEAAPARPEQHREDEAGRTDDHEDDADDIDVDARDRCRHGPRQDGP